MMLSATVKWGGLLGDVIAVPSEAPNEMTPDGSVERQAPEETDTEVDSNARNRSAE